MLGCAYVGSLCTCPLGGVANITISPNAKVVCPEGIIAVAGSTGVCSFHTTFTVIPTSRVTIMGLPIARVGDLTSCGGNIVQGSVKVLVG